MNTSMTSTATSKSRRHHTLEDYILENKVLGEGGYGRVELCTCKHDSKKYAMKIVKEFFILDFKRTYSKSKYFGRGQKRNKYPKKTPTPPLPQTCHLLRRQKTCISNFGLLPEGQPLRLHKE